MKLKLLVLFLLISAIGFSGDISSETDFVNEDYNSVVSEEVVDNNTTLASTLMEEDPIMDDFDDIVEESTHIGPYVGGGVSLIAIEGANGKKANFFSKSSSQDRQIGINLLVGYDIIDNVAVEARALFGVAKEKTTKLQNYALFVKPNIDVITNLNIYGLLGFASSNVANPADTRTSGVTWGGGLSYNIKELIGGYDVAIYTDFLNLLHKDKTFSMAGLNFGAIYQF